MQRRAMMPIIKRNDFDARYSNIWLETLPWDVTTIIALHDRHHCGPVVEL
ncbi:MAG: hypothetical protein ABI472_06095 [Ginsengibacter sp.]